MPLTLSGIIALPISSLSCFPVDAVMTTSFISFLRPFTPLTSNILVIFSFTVSAGSKSLKQNIFNLSVNVNQFFCFFRGALENMKTFT